MEHMKQNWPVSSSLKELLSSLKPHDHLCLIYESVEEWAETIVPFILSGIERGEKCIYVIDSSTAQQVKTIFQQAGLDVAAAENRGQLVIVHERDTYTRHGFFDPDIMMEQLISETEEALKQGYPALRVAGEMSWALRGHAGSEKLLEYEAKLNSEFFPNYPCVAICQYDRWKFDPEIIKGVILTHPILIRGGQVYRNFYYIKPEEYLNHKKSEREVQHWLNNLERERRIQEDLRESGKKYHTLFNQAVAGIYLHDLQGQMIDVNQEACSQSGYSREGLLDLAVFDLHPDKADTVNLPKEEILKQWNSWQPGERFAIETEHQRKDGTVFPVQVSTGVVQYGNQKLILAIVTDITERKQHERLLQARYNLLEFATRHGLDEVLQHTLDEVCEVVDSPIGFYHFVSPDEKMLTLKAWSTDTLKYFCDMGQLRGKSYSVAEAGVWADCMQAREAVIHNDYKDLPHRKGMPDGHAEVIRELVVPIMRDDRIVAILGVGNKAGDYDDRDVQIVSYFADLAWEVAERKQAEEALRESELLLERTGSIAQVGGWKLDIETMALNWTKETCNIHEVPLNYNPSLDQAIEFFHPDDREILSQAIQLAIDRGEPYDMELQFITAKGNQLWTRAVCMPEIVNGKTVRLRGTFQDITVRKQAEQALIESQQTLDALMEHIPIGITIADGPDYRLRRVSRHGLELMGWPREKHEGLTVEEILNQWEVSKPDGVTKADLEELPLIKAISKGEKVFGQELVQIHQDGRAIPIICDAGPIRNEDGQITGGIVAWQDITERKKSEKALTESEQRARRQRAAVADLFLEETITAGEIMPAVQKITEVLSRSVKTERVSIWVIDENCEQLQCLDLYESSTGKHSNGDILDMKTFPRYFASILKDSRISVANAQEDPRSRELNEGYFKPLGITSLLDAGIVVEGKLKGVVSFEHVGGQRIWHVDEEAFASTIASIVGQLFVEAERKKANEEIRILNEELEQRVKARTAELEAVNEELASFAYSVSHDFRAPLRAIDGFSARLTEKYNDQLDEKGRHYLSRIRNAALYMSELIDDLLKLSRINRAEVNLQKVDLSRLAEERIQLLQETEPERRVQVKIAPGLTARGDQALLQAALENLLENAWKFSANETQATIEVGQTTINGEEVLFVRDNGVGFNMAYANRLFGAFQRLHGADEFPGTGIGLATVQRIINRHGGKVWAESEVGKGAIFYFTVGSDIK